MEYIYEAIVTEPEEGDLAEDYYGVELPDWGSATEGKGREEAIRMGLDLLMLEVTSALADGRELPCPVFGHDTDEGTERVTLAVKTTQEEADKMWPWLTTGEAAEILGVTPARVRSLVLSGTLRSIKSGRDLNVSRADVAARKKSSPQPGRPRKEAIAA